MTTPTPNSTSVTDPADAGATPVDAATAADDGASVPPVGAPPVGAPTIVDFSRAARRVRRSAFVLGATAMVGWVATGLATGGVAVSDLGAWAGLALGGMFLVEVVVVGGSALRGMLHAGDRGERLAGGDVGLLPPQLTRARRPGDDDGPG